MNVNNEDLEHIKILKGITNEVIATITFLEGKIHIKTEEPYRNYIKYKKEKEKEEKKGKKQ